MECTTNRPGAYCKFMGKHGCTFVAGACFEIIEKCEGCGRIVKTEAGRFCSVYPHPEMKWQRGICNFATHVKPELPRDATGKTINPLKAAKRASKGR